MAVDANDLPGQDPDDAPATPVASAPPSLTPEAVRNSPEYRALERQNRALAREAGTAKANEKRSREAAEAERLEAQRQRDESLQTEIVTLLGEDGLAAWDEFATLSQTDPLGAARKWAEITGKMEAARVDVQEAPPVTTPQPPAQPVQQQVAQPRTLDGGAPLSTIAAPDPDDARIAELETNFGALIERNAKEPNRVTERERADGIMGYMEAAVRKFRRGQASTG